MTTGSNRRVAIIGAGPGGLIAASYLKKHKFFPTLFEQGKVLGGQWSGDPQYSGVWPSMRTNTSKVISCFSVMPHNEDIPIYPSRVQMHAYLSRFAEQEGLLPHLHTNTKVEVVEHDSTAGLWRLTTSDNAGSKKTETYPYVVVASGRFNKPSIPSLNGLQSSAVKVSHTFNYRGAEDYRGKNVLVCGGSISALEIASDLALGGTENVFVSSRRQRYIFHKLLAGVPTDHVVFSRFAAMLGERARMDIATEQLRNLIERTCGNPVQYGAPRPANNILEAGITQSQYYLPLVAEGRIQPKPWVESFRGSVVEFADGSKQSVDAVILGTGYALNLPFLSKELQGVLNLTDKNIDLYAHTFHPGLPGIAFIGQFDVAGPNLPLLELQARWIAYVMGGIRQLPNSAEMKEAMAIQRQTPHSAGQIPMHVLAIRLARLAGVEPDIKSWPQLTRALMFGPLTAMSFRLSGPDNLSSAASQIGADAAAFGAMPTSELSQEQNELLRLIAS